jgi:hypothetical protein
MAASVMVADAASFAGRDGDAVRVFIFVIL